jgi:hypothetical protein
MMKKRCSNTMEECLHHPSLISIVFSWTLEDLLNENLFKYQVLSSLFNNLTYEKYIELLRNYLAEL